jgi:hypothetical protein
MRSICLAAMFGMACTVGAVPPYGSTDGGATEPTPTPPTPGNNGSGCRSTVTTNIGDGHHNAGQDCMNACHNHGFTLAGTLFNGSAGASGGTITVTDNAGSSFDLVSQANGNFYTTQPVAFPVTVFASRCPSIHNMPGTVSATAGTSAAGCNQSGCHEPAAGAGPIHL